MRKLSLLAAAVLAALTAGVLVVAVGSGSSHSEAPGTQLDRYADDTDTYAFKAPDAPNALTIVANWVPFEDPAGGPNFYRFDDRAAYYLNIDNTGDGRYDIRYRFRFKTKVENPNSFLYALPGVSSITDPKLNIKQSYSIVRERYRDGRKVAAHLIANGLPVAPSNVGPKTFPNYDAVAQQAIRSLPDGGKVFTGQVDDPFFVDLGATFDALTIRNGTGNAGGGKDDVAGYNVQTIALQVPEEQVTRDARPVTGAKDPNAVVGVWSSTNRPRVQVSGVTSSYSKKSHRAHAGSDDDEVQVSRLGNPLVNEVVIPLGMKDRYNATQPQDDAKNFGQFVLNPELARLLNALYPGLNVPEKNRTDIVTALLTGVPGLTQIGKNPAAADTLKINLGVDPTDKPSRFGVLAGDTQGFPNGRRLTDDVVDIEERVIGGFLVGNKLPLGDGVDQNDKPFRATFPYVASPAAGLDSQLKRMEPQHAPVPGDPSGF
jgi:hypothetical protein